MRHCRPLSFKAFTLIELILVLALIAMIVGIVVPSMASFSRGQRVGNSADQLVAVARWARAQAITRGVTFRLNFDGNQHIYWLTVQDGASHEKLLQSAQTGTGTSSTVFANVREDWGRQFSAEAGVTFVCNVPVQTDGQYIAFRPTGRCDPGTIRFTDSDGRSSEAGCLSATEQYHVLSDDEINLERNLPQLPPAFAQ